MKQNSSIDEVETWLVGLKTYKSVANPRKTYSHHINGFTIKSQKGPKENTITKLV